jgi:hypothetical protein
MINQKNVLPIAENFSSTEGIDNGNLFFKKCEKTSSIKKIAKFKCNQNHTHKNDSLMQE